MSECQSAREAAFDALVNGTSLPAGAAQHLGGCAACRSEIEELRELWQGLGRLPQSAVTIPSADQAWLLARSATSNYRFVMRKTHLVAALLAALLVGGLAGYTLPLRSRQEPAVQGTTFLLLLHEHASSDTKHTPEQLRSIVGEYRDWAQRLDADKKLVSAEKLRTEARWLAPDGSALVANPTEMVSGFFLLRARDYDEALRLARTSPHLKYGGTIEVRAIESTSPGS